ncbi:MAG: hypothetical protein RBS23_03345 [Mariniphaga sp.]|nr:hypothetical protein [Mariniphaga sp.]
MKKLIFLPLLFWSVFAFAQRSIAVQSNGTANFYAEWAQAWQNTQAGDTIYLPGGTFNTGTITIDKPITIIGVGHDTAYIHDKLFSHLNGEIRLLKGADGTMLHGFQMAKLRIGTNADNETVKNITISRCRFTGDFTLGSTNPSTASQIIVDECVLNNVNGMNAKHVSFTKNNLTGSISNFDQNVSFVNNFFSYNYYTLYRISSTLFRNNIFRSSVFYNASDSPGNLFENNIFVRNFTIDPQTDLNTWNNNYFNQPLDDIFVNFAEGDYHLKPTSVGVGAGTDGYDIGIYGTAIPYKEGAVPFTPRIVQESVSKQTDDDGKININVKVEAQER